jgi:Fe-S cluster assembly protein SufD
MENKANFVSKITKKFELYESQINGHRNSPVYKLQQKAFQQFKDNGLPNLKTEDWKYTPLAFLNKAEYEFKQSPGKVSEEIAKSKILADSYNVITFVDGFFAEHLSQIKENDKIRIGSVKNYIIEDSKFAEKLNVAYQSNNFAKNLLNSFSQDGIVVEITKSKVLDNPIQINFINTSGEENQICGNKVYFIARENSIGSIVTLSSTLNLDSNSMIIQNFEIIVEDNANLKHYSMQYDYTNTSKFVITNTEVGKSANYSNYTVAYNGNFTRNDLTISLNGEGGNADLIGFYYGNGKNLIDNHTKVIHAVPNCTSNEIYKGILDDTAVGVFNGKIFVAVDAQKTNAYQSSKSILLSDEAKINTKPELEIYADDVKCSHGASTGTIDEDSLFYLRARGISKELAQKLLLHAYASEILDKIELLPVREKLETLISDFLD